MSLFRRYVRNVLVAIDQGGNAWIGGDPDETISSRTAKAANKGYRVARFACWVYARFDPGHCEKSLEPDEGGFAIFQKRKETP